VKEIITNEHIRGAKLALGITRSQAIQYLLSEPTEEEIDSFLKAAMHKKYDREMARAKIPWYRLARSMIVYRAHYHIDNHHS
jgi:hypothetical protein